MLLAGSLSGCGQLVLQAVSVGAMASMDRRTAASQLEDETIQLKATAALSESMGTSVNVYITSYNRQVLLTGEVPDAASRELAQRLVSRIDNVRTVFNELEVANGTTLAQRGADLYVTAKVRAALFETPDLSSNAFRVVTTRGTVYLMGRVTPRESDRATRVTQQVSGVRRVVRVFEVISEEEFAQFTQKGGRADK